jgi:hypothetical protein
MLGSKQVQKPYKGWLVRALCFDAVLGRVEARVDRDSGAPASLASNRQTSEARERRSGEGLIETLAGKP